MDGCFRIQTSQPLGASALSGNKQHQISVSQLTKQRGIIDQAITQGTQRYISACQARIDAFVDEHYSFRGALKIHAHALGFDLLRVPINIVWSVANILFALLAGFAKLAGFKKLHERIKKIPPGLETDMDRQISWLIMTELLQLPYQQAERVSETDSLMQEILATPALKELLERELEPIYGIANTGEFRQLLDQKLAEYRSTRTGAAELASNMALLFSSKAALGQASFSTISAGYAVSASVAHATAVSNFWLGATAGSYYYAMVPVTVSMRLLIVVTALIAIVLAIVSTFIGIVTDPLQAKLGLHQKRLQKLVSAIEADIQGDSAGAFRLREKYMGRIFDVVDFLSVLRKSVS